MVNKTVKIGDIEYKYRGLNVIERAPLRDEIEFRINKYLNQVLGKSADTANPNDYHEAVINSMSNELAVKIVLMATELKQKDLIELDNEIIIKRLASHILNESYLNQIEKKS